MKKTIRIKERKLGRERAWGLAYKSDGLIEIDPRMVARRYLDTLIHEMLHILFPDASETKVNRAARAIAIAAWEKGYRRMAR